MIFLVKILIAWRKFIIASALVTAFAMAVVSLLLPEWYVASTSVFPPETKSRMPFYAELLENLQVPFLGPVATGARPSSIYIDILLSRKVGEQIVEEFDLRRVYETVLIGDAIAILHSHASFSLLENGLLKIDFEDTDPERASAIANRFVELLDEFNQELNVTQASRTREFIAGQLELHKKDLNEAEEVLRRFQEENEALELDEQVRSALSVISNLTAEAIALEVELEILGQYASKSSEEYMSKKQRYDEIQEQLKKFKVNSARDDQDFVRSFFPTLDKVPQVTLELLRLTRRVQVEEKVYELLITEYERARIDEARDTPTVQVLDRASVPERKSRPKRKALVILGGLIGLGWSSLLSVVITLWRQQEEQRGTVQEILSPIRDDLLRIFRRKK